MDVIVDCWENERWMPGRGWGASRLPTDRPLWSDKKGATLLRRESFLLPPGWCWNGPWAYQPYGDSPDGWYYAVDFTIPTRYCSSKQSITSCVRRRRWIRKRVLILPTDAPENIPHPREVMLYGFSNASEGSPESIVYCEGQHRSVAAFFDDISTFFSARADGRTRLGKLVLTRERCRDAYQLGFAQCLRGPLWLALSGAYEKKQSAGGAYFDQLRREVESQPDFANPKHEINIDVLRTLPSHEMFLNGCGQGSSRIRTLLFCLHAHLPTLPYFQSFSYLASLVVLNVDGDEDAFWLLVSLLGGSDILPSGYYSDNRLDRDLEVLLLLCKERLTPAVVAHIENRSIDVTLFANGWIQAMLSAHLPVPTACRVLDVIFAERSNAVVLRVALMFLKSHSNALLKMSDAGSLGQFANSWARSLWDPSTLMSRLLDDSLQAPVEQLRKRFFDVE